MTPEELDRLLSEVNDNLDEPRDLDDLDEGDYGETLQAQAAAARATLGPGLQDRIRAELAVIPAPRPAAKPRRWWSGLFTVLPVLAAGLLLVPVGRVALTPQPVLPEYTVTTAGAAEVRSEEPDGPLRLTGEVPLRIKAIAAPTDVDTEVRAWIHHGTVWQPLVLTVENAGEGSWDVKSTVTGIPDGDHTLLIGIGPDGPRGLLRRAYTPGAEAQFSDDELQAAVEAGTLDGWSFRSEPITLYGGNE